MRLVLILALALTACASPPTPDGVTRPFESEASYQAQRAAATRALGVAVGHAFADDVAACRAVAVGATACGGATSFTVYSLDAADPSVVEMAASRVTALDHRANEQFSVVSTCEALEPPPLALRDGLCVADR